MKKMIGAAVFGLPLILYVLTLAPGPVDNGDSGDLLAAAATWGVPHPSGYPLYTILAGICYRLPLPGLAPPERVALLSALCAAGACWLGWRLLVALGLRPGPALLFALFAAVNPVLWSQAVMAEVYTLHLCLALALAWLVLQLMRGSLSFRGLFLLGLVFGLGLANHLTTLLFLPVPAVVLARWAYGTGRRQAIRGLTLVLAGLTLGLACYLYLPLQGGRNPAHSWGAPATAARFSDHVTLKQFRGDAFGKGLLPAKLNLLGAQLLTAGELAVTLLAFAGLVGLAVRREAAAAALALGAALYGAAVFFAFGQSSAATLEGSMAVHFIPLFAAVALGAGLGWHWLAGRYPRAGRWLLVGLALLLPIKAYATYPEVNRRGDWIVTNFAVRLLAMVPERGLLLVEHDDITFPLWYLQAAGERPDVTVVNGTLLHFDWYRTRFDPDPTLTPAALLRKLIAAAPAAYAYPNPDPLGDLGVSVVETKGLLRILKPDPDGRQEARRILEALASIEPAEFDRPRLTLMETGMKRMYVAALNNTAIRLAAGGDPALASIFITLAQRLAPEDIALRDNQRRLRSEPRP